MTYSSQFIIALYYMINPHTDITKSSTRLS